MPNQTVKSRTFPMKPRVSRLVRHRSLARTKSRVTSIIHVKIRPTRNAASLHPVNPRVHSDLCADHKAGSTPTVTVKKRSSWYPSSLKTFSSSVKSTTIRYSQVRPSNGTATQFPDGKSEKMDQHSSAPSARTEKHQKEERWPDWTAVTDDHHRNKQKKARCSPKCIIPSVLIALVLAGVITAVLVVVLPAKSTSQTYPTSAVLRWNTTGITVAGGGGQPGNASNQLSAPFGMALDSSNTLYIGDSGNNRVQKYLPGASNGITVAGQANSSAGSSLAYLHLPFGVQVDENQQVYVSDGWNGRVLLWPSSSTSGTLLQSGLIVPYGLFRDPNTGIIYIADYGHDQILSYDSSRSLTTVVAGGNGNGTNITQLYRPTGVVFDSSSNSLVIVNYNANNVVRWAIGASSWTLLAGNSNGAGGSSSTSFSGPTGMALDPMGNMYVADRGNQRIQFFLFGEMNGTTILGTTGHYGNSSTLLYSPSTVILDSQLNLYVADRDNNRVQKFLRY